MFAVPGWSISTSDLKPQKDLSSNKTESSNGKASNAAKPIATGANQIGQGAGNESAKKRKRDNGVTKSNVDEMFKRHIEGQTDKSGKKNKNKTKKNKEKKENRQPETDEAVQEKPAEAREGRANKKQKKARDEEKRANGDASATVDDIQTATTTSVSLPPPMPPSTVKLTPLQQKMRDKLISSRFRHLNETLYTTPSKQAQAMFEANPELFTEYHNGFSRQVKESWPSNPVDGYIAAVRKRGVVPAHHDKRKHNNSNNAVAPLPRRPNGFCTIADLGCGDAQFARSLTASAKKLQLKLTSYDLQSPDEALVTKADIANLPVTDGSVDVTIFCLSLMGTNWVSFIEEAWRVLRGDGKGECWVSEVKSRFGKVNRKKAQIGLKRDDAAGMSNTQKKKLKNKKKKKNGNNDSDDEDDNDHEEIYAEDAQPASSGGGNDDTDISAFVEVFKSRGFVLKQESVDKSNKMFVKMEFIKAGGAPTKGKYAGITPAPAGRPEKKAAAAPVQTKKRFIDRDRGDDENKGMTAEQEAKVLKPCVYKIR